MCLSALAFARKRWNVLTFYALRCVRASASADKDFVILTLQNKKKQQNSRLYQKNFVTLQSELK